MRYTLQNDGDAVEKSLYQPFIQPRFPSYEVFWQKFVIPLTRRPVDIQFCTDADLAALGFGPEHVCIAQLHYTVLVQLGRCFGLFSQQGFGVDHLALAMSCLVGAQDVAFELLERFVTRGSGTYDPWLDKRPRRAAANIRGGKEAQEEWKRKQNYPLQDIRDYRNNLVHGRTPPGIVVGGVVTVPKLGKQHQYFDWRLVTATAAPPVADFDSPANLFSAFFTMTVNYIENSWQAHLLAHG
jgi:hypothetical protein